MADQERKRIPDYEGTREILQTHGLRVDPPTPGEPRLPLEGHRRLQGPVSDHTVDVEAIRRGRQRLLELREKQGRTHWHGTDLLRYWPYDSPPED